ncbi:MAG: WecB/TagA/CpsF family glycosyltransferase [Opitutaceae bacterium]
MVAAPQAPGCAQALPISLLGVTFDPLTIGDAVERAAAAVAGRRPHFFVTANVDFLVKARRDRELRRVLLGADHVLCDGTPLLWASRWLGNALPGRAAGSDLVPELIRRAAERGWRIFFLGGTPEVAADAAHRVEVEHPGLPAVAHFSPPFRPFGPEDDAEIAARIKAAAPDLLFVSFGCPKQEKWIAAHYRQLGVPVTMGVGATVDFLAGRVCRAPRWMRRGGIEWGFRLAREPRRLFRRYADDLIHFFPQLWLQRRCLPPAPESGPVSEPSFTATSYGLRVDAGTALHRAALERQWRFWSRALDMPGHCVLALDAVRSIDSTGLALLASWRKRRSASRRALILFKPSRPVRHALARMRLSEFFLIAEP